jgi:hypothetical protein
MMRLYIMHINKRDSSPVENRAYNNMAASVGYLRVRCNTRQFSAMKSHIFHIIVLIIFLWINPACSSTDNDESSDFISHLLKNDLVRRHLLEKYLLHERRDAPTFTSEERHFQQTALLAHNSLRATHCAPPLVLDDEISARSRAYAEVLASNDSRLIHSTDRHGLLGENLYAITRSSPIKNVDGSYSKISFDAFFFLRTIASHTNVNQFFIV